MVSSKALVFVKRMRLRRSIRKLCVCLCIIAPIFATLTALFVGGLLAYLEGWGWDFGVWVALDALTLSSMDIKGDDAERGRESDTNFFGMLSGGSNAGVTGSTSSSSSSSSVDNNNNSAVSLFHSPASKCVAALGALWCLALTSALLGTLGGPLLHPVLEALGLLPDPHTTSPPPPQTPWLLWWPCSFFSCFQPRSSLSALSHENERGMVEGVDVAKVRDPLALVLRTVLRTAARVEEVAKALEGTQRQLGQLLLL
jgi:hypothetical protein